tara:strand:+ start:1399 stop:2640 length:1242 start_codon:yes stop_codon:yes gene_type:complete
MSYKSNHYALVDGNIVDVIDGKIISGHSVVIKNGIINDICQDKDLKNNIPQILINGRYIAPGLIDCHAHCFVGQFGDRGNVMPSEMTARAGQHLEGMLQRGFTTVRDAGGADSGHRSAVEKGLFPGPRLFVSGKILSQTGGHGDQRAIADVCGCESVAGGMSVIADGVDAVRKAVRENVRQGVDQIKIMGGGGVASPGDKLVHPQYSLEEIEAIVDEANRCGRYVMAHIYSDIGIRRAVEKGVRSVEHGNFLSCDTAKVMSERDAHLVPTLVTYEADAKYGPGFGWNEENSSKNAEVLAAGLTSLENALSNDVNVGYGTDLCWSPKSYQGDGLKIHEKVCGAAEALRHCTLNNARILRMEKKIGEITAGAHADLVILDSNPLQSLSCFSQTSNSVVAVLQAGRAVRDDKSLFG